MMTWRQKLRKVLHELQATLPCDKPARLSIVKQITTDGDYEECERTPEEYVIRLVDLTKVPRADLEEALGMFLLTHGYAHARAWPKKQPKNASHGPHFGIELALVEQEYGEVQ